MLLSLFGDSLPFESIYADMCTDRRVSDDEETVANLTASATDLREITGLELDQVLKIDPIVRSVLARGALLTKESFRGLVTPIVGVLLLVA